MKSKLEAQAKMLWLLTWRTAEADAVQRTNNAPT